jgi:hypothetical protein
MSTATFSVGGTFPPHGFAADTVNEAISAASDHQRRDLHGHQSEKHFVVPVDEQLANLQKHAGTNAAFVAKQLNKEPIQTQPPLRSPGLLHSGWTVGRMNTHSVTF